MDQRIQVTQLAAEARQVLLAATVDIEQRWQFLTPEDRVAALTDLIALTLVYNRAFADGASTDDESTRAVNKILADGATLQESLLAEVAKAFSDTTTFTDAYIGVASYVRTYDEQASATDLFTSACAYIRAANDAVSTEDACTHSAALGKSDSVSGIDAALLGFSTQVSEAITAGETLSKIFSPATKTEALSISDASAKTFTTAFSDIGGLYATVDYFDDDYVEEGTGPAVYDTFSYTLN